MVIHKLIPRNFMLMHELSPECHCIVTTFIMIIFQILLSIFAMWLHAIPRPAFCNDYVRNTMLVLHKVKEQTMALIGDAALLLLFFVCVCVFFFFFFCLEQKSRY